MFFIALFWNYTFCLALWHQTKLKFPEFNEISNHKSKSPIFGREECLLNNIYTNRIEITINVCIINCTFRSIGESTEMGGAIYISINNQDDNQNIIQNTIFINCFSNKGGAIYIYSQQKFNISLNNCSFINNAVTTQDSYGGAIFIESAIALFNECSFSENSVSTQIENGYGDGGSIYSNFSNININNCNFNNNEALSTAGETSNRGAALYILSSISEIKDSLFDSNSMSKIFSLGVISIDESESIFDHCKFRNNFANSELNLGVAFYLYGSNVTFNNCEFINNSASASGEYSSSGGGAIYISEADAKLNNCLFKSNSVYATGLNSFSGGGAITSSLGSFVIDKCSFIDNIASEGEVLFIVEKTEESTLILNENIFERNLNTMSQMKSLIYLDFEEEVNSVNEFTNNKIFLMNTDRIIVFDGTEGTVIRKWVFNDNCILPYDQQYFKGDSLELYEQTGQIYISFNDAFQEECTLIPTNEATETNNENDYLTSSITNIESKYSSISDNDHTNDISTSSNNENDESNIFIGSENTYSDYLTSSNGSPFDAKRFTYSISFSVTFFVIRSVSFSFSYSLSNIYSFNSNEEFIILQTYSLHLFPYIIHYLSPSYVPSYIPFLIRKARITAEQLIGIVCGTTAIFFFILYIIIRIVNKSYKQNDNLYWTILGEFIDDLDKGKENLKSQERDLSNDDKNEDSSDYDLDFWINY